MKLLRSSGFAVALLALACAMSGAAQSVADVARDSKQKKQESTRRVWTNDDLGSRALEIKLLGPPREHPPILAPFVSTPLPTVRRLLQVAKVQPGELVFDIGSGDGRIVIMAAEEFGARGVGIELDPLLVTLSQRAVEAHGLETRVQIIHANALDVDLSPADVVTVYLTPAGLKLVVLHLEQTLRPGTRVVSNVFKIPGWTPDAVSSSASEEIWLYRVPRKAGAEGAAAPLAPP